MPQFLLTGQRANIVRFGGPNRTEPYTETFEAADVETAWIHVHQRESPAGTSTDGGFFAPVLEARLYAEISREESVREAA